MKRILFFAVAALLATSAFTAVGHQKNLGIAIEPIGTNPEDNLIEIIDLDQDNGQVEDDDTWYEPYETVEEMRRAESIKAHT